MRRFIVFTLFALLSTGRAALGQNNNAGDFTISPIRITSLKSTPYMYVSETVTLSTIGPVIEKRMSELDSGIKDGAFLPSGPAVLVYHGTPTGDRTVPFKLDMGFPVAEGTVPAGDYQLGKLESMQEAVTLYTGPVSQIGRAYGRIFEKILSDGHIPIGERRERYLYWEGNDSPNNVILIEIGLQN